MKKKIKIYENEIKRATRRKLMENYLDEQHEMRDTYSRADYKSSPREKGVKGVFGKYGEEIPPSVLRYMRKNPAAIVKRLYKLYGNEIFDSVKGSGDEFMAIDSKTGKYGEEIPPSVLRYMRKNPAAIIKRLHKLYGNEIFDAVKGSGEEFMSVDAQSGKYGPFDRDNDGISSSVDQDDDGDGMLDLNVDVMGEAEETTAMKYSREELAKMAATDGSVTIPNLKESTRKLYKKFLNSRK